MVVRSGVGGVIHADRIRGYLAWSSSVANQRYAAFGIYAIHLLLSALWTPLFFGYHSPGWALVSIIAQWLAIAFNYRGVLSHQTGCGFTVGARFVVGHVCVAVEYVDLDVGPVM